MNKTPLEKQLNFTGLYKYTPTPLCGPQEIPDCVGWMGAEFANTLLHCDIHARRTLDSSLPFDCRQSFVCVEAVYAAARAEGNIRGQDGAKVEDMFTALQKYGIITLDELMRLGHSPHYSVKRARNWGDKGIPRELIPSRRLQTVKKVTSYDFAVDKIRNGYPIGLSTTLAFKKPIRDVDGFVFPTVRHGHAILLTGVREGKRPGLLMYDWREIGGDPFPGDCPRNSAWLDRAICEEMFAEDCAFTGSFFNGYENRSEIF